MDGYYSEYQRQSFYFQDPARYEGNSHAVQDSTCQSSCNISEFPLYPDYDLDRELSLAERAVTLVTNNLTVANLWVIIPVILLGNMRNGEMYDTDDATFYSDLHLPICRVVCPFFIISSGLLNDGLA